MPSFLANADPTKMKLDSNINIKQEHIDQLFSSIKPIIDKHKEDNPLLCDAACRDDQRKNAAYNEYAKAQRKFGDAPEELAAAEKKYYELSPNGQSYANFKEKEAKGQISKIVDILSTKFDTKVEQITDKIQNYGQQNTYTKHMEDLKDSFGRDINQMGNEIERYRNKININDRLSIYYSQQIKSMRHTLYYLKIIYWPLYTVYLCYFIIYKQLFLQKRLAILSILLLLLPLTLRYIVRWYAPVKIMVPPPDAVCPTKPPKKLVPPSTPLAPEPPKIPKWVPAPKEHEKCPPPSLSEALKGLLPQMGHGSSSANVKKHFQNWEYKIQDATRSFTKKISNII